MSSFDLPTATARASAPPYALPSPAPVACRHSLDRREGGGDPVRGVSRWRTACSLATGRGGPYLPVVHQPREPAVKHRRVQLGLGHGGWRPTGPEGVLKNEAGLAATRTSNCVLQVVRPLVAVVVTVTSSLLGGLRGGVGVRVRVRVRVGVRVRVRVRETYFIAPLFFRNLFFAPLFFSKPFFRATTREHQECSRSLREQSWARSPGSWSEESWLEEGK